MFQHTAARRRLARRRSMLRHFGGFNTQPPEGGWLYCPYFSAANNCFNTQPPEGGWRCIGRSHAAGGVFQHTAARRRLEYAEDESHNYGWFQHTAARRRLGPNGKLVGQVKAVSTHSRPKAAGFPECDQNQPFKVSTHSRPKAAGQQLISGLQNQMFQHTAARRRLGAD